MIARARAALFAVLLDDGGATLVEYAIIASLLGIVGIAGMQAIAAASGARITQQQDSFNTVQLAQ